MYRSYVCNLLIIISGFILGELSANDEVAELCFECHTGDNTTPDPLIPKLIGQNKDYLLKEINSFRMGYRNDTTMTDIARNLTDEKQVLEIVEFYSSQPAMSGKPDNDPIVRKGKMVYQVRRCFFCHGEYGKSKENVFIEGIPIIGGQNSEYLYKTILELRNSTRPTDIYGLMQRSILQLSTDDIEALSRYIATLP